jgi:hypothetical protein
MSYSDISALGRDVEFARRLAAGLTVEATPKSGDLLADQILRSPDYGASLFMPLIASAPGFGDKYATGGQEAVTDGDLLAAMQASWSRVTELYATTLNSSV